jgi:hypothetical protein
MPRKYQPFPFEDIGLGLDTYSPKDKIPPGALSYALNIDAEANSTISLRKGYERYYGNFPFRPNLAVVGDDKLKLTFGGTGTVNLSTQGNGPLYIEWKAYVTEGDTTSYKSFTYYRDNYSIDLIKTFEPEEEYFKFELANASTLYGYVDDDVIFLSYTKEDSGLVSNFQISPELVEINTNTDTLTIKTSTNPAPAFVYAIPLATVSDEFKKLEHFEDIGADEEGFVTLTVNISTLAFLPPLVHIYEKSGDVLTEIKPYSVSLNLESEDVIVKIDTNGSSFTGRVAVIAPGHDNTKSVGNIQQQEIQLIKINNVEDPFNFIQVWASGDDGLYLTEVSYVKYKQLEQLLEVGYYVPTALPESVQAVWHPAAFSANTVEVAYSEPDFADNEYTSPQITVWGFDHANSYKKQAAQAPYVIHVDNYRSSQDEERLIASLGGNLFSAESSTEKFYASTVLESKSRVLTESKIEPLYTNSAKVSSIVKAGNSAIVTIEGASPQRGIATDYDYLVLTGCAYKANNGRYLITDVDNPASPSVFTIANPNAKDEGSAGKANSFSGAIDLAEGQKFALGDFVEATSLSLPLEVVSYNIGQGDVYVCGCTSPVQFAGGINLYLKRTSSILPLESVEGIVRGDMLKVSYFNRSFRVKQVTSFSDVPVSIATTPNTAQGEVVDYTVTITNNELSHNLNVGDKIFLYGSNDALLDGEHVVFSTPDNSTITFKIAEDTTTNSAKILGNCVEIDESITFSTGPTPVNVGVEGRWAIVESPINRQEGREESRSIHFDEFNFYNQPSIQSSVVNNSMYLANGEDETKKYDGTSIYNAGLPPFQPWCFLSVDPEGSALAGGATTEFAAIDVSFDDRYFVVDTNFAAVNDRIKVDTTGQLLTITSVQPFGTGKYKIFVEEDIYPWTKTSVTIPTGDTNPEYIEQRSGITMNDYRSGPTTYTLLNYPIGKTSIDDAIKENYTIKVQERPENYDVIVSSISIDGRETSIINEEDGTIEVYLHSSSQDLPTENYPLRIKYEAPVGTRLLYNNETIIPGSTQLEFSNSVTFDISAYDSSEKAVTISLEEETEYQQLFKWLECRGVLAFAQPTSTPTVVGDVNWQYDVYLYSSPFVTGKNKTDKVFFDAGLSTVRIYENSGLNPQVVSSGFDALLLTNGGFITIEDESGFERGFKAYFPSNGSETIYTDICGFCDFYVNNRPVIIPDQSSVKVVGDPDTDFSILDVSVPYGTNLASMVVEYTSLGRGGVEVYNFSTSSWEKIDNGETLDLGSGGDYLDGDVRFRSISESALYKYVIRLKIEPAPNNSAYFDEGDVPASIVNQSYFTCIWKASGLQALTVKAGLNQYNTRVFEKGSDIPYQRTFPDSPGDFDRTNFSIKVPPEFNVDEVKTKYTYVGTNVRVGSTAHISNVTLNSYSKNVKITAVTDNSTVTKDYVLSKVLGGSSIEWVKSGNNEAGYVEISDGLGGLDRYYTLYVPRGSNLNNLPISFSFKGDEVSWSTSLSGTYTAIDSGDAISIPDPDGTYTEYPVYDGDNGRSNKIFLKADSTIYKLYVIEKDFKIGLSTSEGFIDGYYAPLDIEEEQDGSTSKEIIIEVPYEENISALAATFDAPGEDGDLIKANIYRYYMRFNALDRNENLIASAMLGSDDMYAEVFEASNVDIKALAMPAFNELDYSRIDFELYRTVANSVAPFYRVYTSALEYGANTGYINVTDNITDFSLTGDDQDTITANLLGGELGTRLERPPVGKVVTSADNRLVIGNITSPHIADVTIRKNGDVSELVVADFNDMTIDIEGETTLNLVIDKDVTFTSTISDVGVFTPTGDIAQGQWVYVFTDTPGENKDLSVVGWYKTTATNTIPVKGDDNPTTYSFCYAQDKIPVYIEEDGNINQRNFYKLPLETQVSTKISLALNAVIAQANSADAWLLAQGGQSFPNGQFRLRQVANPDGQITITPTYDDTKDTGKFKVYVNNLLVDSEEAAVSSRKRFPSRLAVSYRNFSEIFDDCYRTDDLISSIIDVNPADGQEVTAAVPFFGASAFGAAQLSQALVVFKTNSVYLVDIASNSVQKLQTQGQGCTAPKSVAVTKNGIFFANESGVYRLGTDMKVTWMGKALDGIWRNELEKTNFNLLAGHNYAQERRYKLSYPYKGDVSNSRVAVYDSAREELNQVGSWTVYDNHPALGWCNQTADSFFASALGRVYKVRNRGEASDYRDDDQGIPLSFTFGATDFGAPDERKITESVTVQFQNEYGTVSGVKVLTEQSLSGMFKYSGTVTIPAGDTDATIRFSLPQRKGTHVRTHITKDGVVDEGFQISSLTYGVRTTGSDGVPQTRKFRS